MTPVPGQYGDLARQCLRHRLPASGILPIVTRLEQTLRAAVLTDLYLSGRIDSSGPALQIDTTRVSDSATDRILDDVEQHPTRSVGDLLRRGPSLRHDLAQALIEAGDWKPRIAGRYRELSPITIRLHDAGDVTSIVRNQKPAGVRDTCLAILLQPWVGIDQTLYIRCEQAGPFLHDYMRMYGLTDAEYHVSDLIARMVWP